MEQISQIGTELELALMEPSNGEIRDAADRILAALRADPRFVKELPHFAVEANIGPARTIRELHEQAHDALMTLEEKCQGQGVVPVPICHFGAGDCGRRSTPRYDAYVPIIGKEANILLNTLLGVHNHIDQHPGKETEQQRLFTALDPLAIAVTSASPMRFDGTNGINCQRLFIQRKIIYSNEDLLCQLHYASSLEELEGREMQRFNNWAESWAEATGKPSSEFEKFGFVPESTGYYTPRKRNIGKGTWENRSGDINSLPYTLAALALYKGCNDHLIKRDLPVDIAHSDGGYSFTTSSIVVPNYHTLKQLEDSAILRGLQDAPVADYLTHVISFAEAGLPKEDRFYLQPLKKMAATRINVSNQIMAHMRKLKYFGEKFTPEQTTKANIFMREQYLEGLNYSPKDK